MVHNLRNKCAKHQDIRKGEKTMRYEEPKMNVVYLEEDVVTLIHESSGTGGSGTYDPSNGSFGEPYSLK